MDKDAESSADLANGQYSHGHARQSKGCWGRGQSLWEKGRSR